MLSLWFQTTWVWIHFDSLPTSSRALAEYQTYQSLTFMCLTYKWFPGGVIKFQWAGICKMLIIELEAQCTKLSASHEPLPKAAPSCLLIHNLLPSPHPNPPLQFLIQWVWDRAREFVFLTKFRVILMLLVSGPPLADHCPKTFVLNSHQKLNCSTTRGS